MRETAAEKMSRLRNKKKRKIYKMEIRPRNRIFLPTKLINFYVSQN